MRLIIEQGWPTKTMIRSRKVTYSHICSGDVLSGFLRNAVLTGWVVGRL